MHILAILLGVLTAIGVFIWRARAGANAARQIADTVEDAGAFVRRRRWQGRAAPRPVDQIDDPMLAATAILVLAIRCERDVTSEDRARVTEEICRTFGIPADQAHDLLGEAEFTVRDITDEPTCAARLARVLGAHCTLEERAQVTQMVKAVTEADGLSELRKRMLRRYAEAAGLPEPQLR